MERKVFAIGFNKTGTTSLHRLFQALSLRSYHGTEWRSCNNIRLLNSYNCFSDGVPHNLPKLDSLFPGAKFIWQVRDLESWIFSRLSHIERQKLNKDFSPSKHWNDDVESVINWIKQRNKYHLFLFNYFQNRKSDVLLVNIIRDKNAASKIVSFLGFEGNFEMPIENENPEKIISAKHHDLLQIGMQKLKIPSSELKFDIFCPSLEKRSAAKMYPVDSKLPWLS